MPCFFFHLADGSMVKDQDGEVLPNTESARAHAARIAHELAEAGDYRGFAIKVTDEQGNEVAYIPIGKRCN
jgi:dipeptidase